ncbi:MAG: hypothetical protein AAFZ15_31915 [Bacteroidota bacterium]
MKEQYEFQQIKRSFKDKVNPAFLSAYPYLEELVEHLSWKFSEAYAEQSESKEEIFKAVAQRMFPPVHTRAIPARAIAQLTPKEQSFLLDTHHSLRLNDTEAYLTPLFEIALCPGQVVYYANSRGIWKKGEGPKNELVWKQENNHPAGGRETSLWFGVQINEWPQGLNELLFYVDGLTTEQTDLLPLSTIEADGAELPLIAGLEHYLTSDVPDCPDEEYFKLRHLRNSIAKQYGACFFSLGLSPGAKRAKEGTSDCGPTVIDLMPEEIKKELAPNIHWFKWTMPVPFEEEKMTTLVLALNCFPAWNARTVTTEDRALDMDTTLPLNGSSGEGQFEMQNEYFLGLHKVWSNERTFKPETLNGADRRGTYSIQYGDLSAYSNEKVLARIRDVIHLAHAHHTFPFKRFENDLKPLLGSLKATLFKIEERVNNLTAQTRCPKFHLHLRPVTPKEVVFIEYFMTQGDYFFQERIRPNHQLLVMDGKKVNAMEQACLMTTPVGGRGPLSENEKELIFQRMLSVQMRDVIHKKNIA